MRFMMIMLPEVYSKPVRPDFVPDRNALEEMGKYNEQLQNRQEQAPVRWILELSNCTRTASWPIGSPLCAMRSAQSAGRIDDRPVQRCRILWKGIYGQKGHLWRGR